MIKNKTVAYHMMNIVLEREPAYEENSGNLPIVFFYDSKGMSSMSYPIISCFKTCLKLTLLSFFEKDDYLDVSGLVPHCGFYFSSYFLICGYSGYNKKFPKPQNLCFVFQKINTD